MERGEGQMGDVGLRSRPLEPDGAAMNTNVGFSAALGCIRVLILPDKTEIAVKKREKQ